MRENAGEGIAGVAEKTGRGTARPAVTPNEGAKERDEENAFSIARAGKTAFARSGSPVNRPEGMNSGAEMSTAPMAVRSNSVIWSNLDGFGKDILDPRDDVDGQERLETTPVTSVKAKTHFVPGPGCGKVRCNQRL